MLPTTPDELRWYVQTWLSFVKSPERIQRRFESEKATLWPKLIPRLSEIQTAEIERMVMRAVT